ncbi:putative polypeptide N-acetylgalactosaminyltransferase-like protein 3 [Hippocampus comes]|uniref:Polypeptide N-acetylgalactosaminyltransferase n=1 Tax=Hippocampus comes TaxID=109280 RepID=A0A3Q2YFH4_HIPCM|nr:PREDICTED: putative polypeptide N-acetylgalactosaminyltransferase-like protein 3 [Hippocampus comes]
MASKGRKWKFLLLLNVLGLAAIFILLTNTKWLQNGLLLPSKAPVLPDPRTVEETTQMETLTEPELEKTTMALEITNESVQDTLKERLSYLEDIVFKHLSGLSKRLGLVEGFGAPGSDGRPITLSSKDQAEAQTLKIKYGYDPIMSDRISLDRTIPDFRPSKCKEYTYPSDLPQIGLIFIFVNEALSVILRSIHSAVNHTPAHLLKEIILVDDCSDDEQLKGPLEEYVNKRYPGLVKIVRNQKREGLIRSRIEGWKVATAEVTGIFDAHMEFTPFWAEPVLARIKEDRTRIILPSIDNINHDTFQLVSYGQPAHGYDWQLWCKYINPSINWKALKDDSAPIRSPAMIGCSFVVNRVYFGELGLFDPDMEVYGGENVELGIRVWLCGGSMEMLPCSRVAHITRFKKPYLEQSLGVLMRRNGIRVAEVWLDEYKRNFYMAWNIPMQGHGIDYGNITERVELRKRLQCKNFKWYLDNVYPEMKTHESTILYGTMYNWKVDKLCLDQGEKVDHAAIMFPCHGYSPQLVRYTKDSQIFLGQLSNSYIDTRCLVDILPNDAPQLLDCNTVSNIRQTKWIFSQGNSVQNLATKRCMEVTPIPTNPFYKVVMQRCSGQKWNLTIPAVRV